MNSFTQLQGHQLIVFNARLYFEGGRFGDILIWPGLFDRV